MAAPITLLIAILAYHSLALAGLLVWKTPLRALPLFLFTLSIHMGANLLEYAGQDIHWLTGALGALYGPQVYLFVREIAFANRPLILRDAWTALPFLAALALPADGAYRPVLVITATLISLAAALLIVRRFRIDAREARAIPDLARLEWLGWATLGFLLIAAFDLARISLEMAGVLRLPSDAGFGVTLAGLIMLTGWLAKGAVDHARRGGPLEASEQTLNVKTGAEPTETQTQQFKAIEQIANDQQIYLEPGLKLAELADAAALTPREASEAINACFGANFSAYINSYRARHARSLIEQNGPQTLLQIALDSGFSSKTAFNTFFKRETGQTPSEFAAGVSNHDPARSVS